MADAKTRPGGDVATFLAAVEPAGKREEALALDAFFRRVTGWEPVLWGGSMLGYGRYRYRYESGREGESLATGFSPRKAEHSIYIMPGYADFGGILARLGPHRMGKSCLYVRRLSEIDMEVLEELVRAGLRDLSARWKVEP
jgi:Domain of unknown function (DU1801)